MGSSQDLAFKLNVARQALRLDQNPTMDRVLAYHRHALAEVDALVQNQGHGTGPQIRALDTPIPVPKFASKPLRKFFLSDKGCKKPKCAFTCDTSGLDKPARSRKYLRRGSEGHRAKACAVAPSKGHKHGDGTDPGCPGSQSSAASPASPSTASVQQGQVSTAALSSHVAGGLVRSGSPHAHCCFVRSGRSGARCCFIMSGRSGFQRCLVRSGCHARHCFASGLRFDNSSRCHTISESPWASHIDCNQSTHM